MAAVFLQSIGGGGLTGSVAQVAAVAGTLVLALIIVGLVSEQRRRGSQRRIRRRVGLLLILSGINT
jgi:hypothetical protein